MPELSSMQLQRQCEHCNVMKRTAKIVGELSSEMFFALFVKVRS